MKKLSLFFVGVIVLALVIGCGDSKQNGDLDENIIVDDTAINTEDNSNVPIELDEEEACLFDISSIIVCGYEWGPSVDAIVLKSKYQMTEFDIQNFKVKTGGAVREIRDIFISDKYGNPLITNSFDENSTEFYYVFDLIPQSGMASPFGMSDFGMNCWKDKYLVSISLMDDTEISINDATFSGDLLEEDAIDKRMLKDTLVFTKDTFEGYETGKTDGNIISLQRAYFEPDYLVDDGVKNPLIIWLHGMGEGGTDIDITLLGNEVTALVRPEIQEQFTSENGNNGAYVLAVQTPTVWMHAPDGSYFDGAKDSIYRDTLLAAIKDYTERNSDVDSNRIYVGGCSNGGYMTMNLLIHDTENFFAAAYPVCEAYTDAGISEEDITLLASKNIWFVQSAADRTVSPNMFGRSTYKRLIDAGASNCWYSMFLNVIGTDAPNAVYDGHWSWVYLFNNQVTRAQDPESVLAGDKENFFGFESNNEGGGTVMPNGCDSIYMWLNLQRNY